LGTALLEKGLDSLQRVRLGHELLEVLSLQGRELLLEGAPKRAA
jgi:hypothetical protein